MNDDLDLGVDDALRALAAEARARQAPERVEAALLRELRRRRAQRWTGWMGAAAAAVLVVVTSWAVLRPGRPPETVARQAATDFLPVAWAEPLRPEEGARIVRVRVPRTTLVSFGLPVNQERLADRIVAEVLLGEDNQVRAIRFEQ